MVGSHIMDGNPHPTSIFADGGRLLQCLIDASDAVILEGGGGGWRSDEEH